MAEMPGHFIGTLHLLHCWFLLVAVVTTNDGKFQREVPGWEDSLLVTSFLVFTSSAFGMNLLVRHLQKSKREWMAGSIGGRLDYKHPLDSKFTSTARVVVISIFMSYYISVSLHIAMSQGMLCIFDIVDGIIIRKNTCHLVNFAKTSFPNKGVMCQQC